MGAEERERVQSRPSPLATRSVNWPLGTGSSHESPHCGITRRTKIKEYCCIIRFVRKNVRNQQRSFSCQILLPTVLKNCRFLLRFADSQRPVGVLEWRLGTNRPFIAPGPRLRMPHGPVLRSRAGPGMKSEFHCCFSSDMSRFLQS